MPDGIETILVCRDPLDNNDLNQIKDVASEMKFEIMITPQEFPLIQS